MILMVLGFPLAGMLATIHLGSFAIISLVPTMAIGGIFLARHAVQDEFFFEQWIKRWPVVGVPILVLILTMTAYCEVNITIAAHDYNLNIPYSIDETEQALEKELEEFFK